MISLARYHDLMIFGLRSIFEYNVSIVDLSIEEPKDTLARLIIGWCAPDHRGLGHVPSDSESPDRVQRLDGVGKDDEAVCADGFVA